MIFFIVVVVFFGFYIFEWWYFGKFDLIGYSYQIFYVFIVFVVVEQMEVFKIDIFNQRQNGFFYVIEFKFSFIYMFGVVLFVFFVDICSVYYFYKCVKDREIKLE